MKKNKSLTQINTDEKIEKENTFYTWVSQKEKMDKEIDLVALKEEGYLCYDPEDIRKFTDILDIF